MQKASGGRKKFQESSGGHSMYKGVEKRKGKGVREVRVPNKKSGAWVGSFVEPDGPRFHSHTSSITDTQFGTTELAAENHVSSEVTESCAASSALSWDMEMGKPEMGLEGGSKSTLYWDEEEVFSMPALIDSMAEGLIITPPALQTGFNWLPPETTHHFTLWAD